MGGAVRNALMGTPVKDVDIATTALPADVMRLAAQAGLHAVPTGLEHGTVTVVAEHVPFEVTTLRKDIETFGRHARVTFTTDWTEDARRRDFTMNALYCGAEGTVHDPLGGYPDLKARRVRFIGDARERIREDYLRILRFFRFLAEYGNAAATRPRRPCRRDRRNAGARRPLGRAHPRRAVGSIGSTRRGRRRARDEPGGARRPVAWRWPGDVDLLARLKGIEDALGRDADPVLRLAALALGAPGRPCRPAKAAAPVGGGDGPARARGRRRSRLRS